MQEAELDAVFLALASTTRRQLLDLIAAQPGATLGQLAEQFAMSRIGLLKHLNVLQDAGLVLSEKVGRERPLYFNPVPLQLIHERWDDQYRSFWASQLTRLKYAVEQGNAGPSAAAAVIAKGAEETPRQRRKNSATSVKAAGKKAAVKKAAVKKTTATTQGD